jgi:phospholipase C
MKIGIRNLALSVSALSLLTAPLMGNMPTFAAEHSSTVKYSTSAKTASPIKHVVVIFQENRSYDNYFGTYPKAPGFKALPGTPKSNGIPAGSVNYDVNGQPHYPTLLNDLKTQDVDHNYQDMITGYDNGKMDKVYQVNEAKAPGKGTIAMGYYDYHAIPALWQYAQHYTLADNYYAPVWGPSTPTALYLIAAQSGTKDQPITGDPAPKNGFGPDQAWGPLSYNLKYTNIGDKLTTAKRSWAWYQSGYAAKDDTYSSHHNPFQYFQNYEDGKYNNNLKDYNNLSTDISNGKLPEVSYVKAGYDSDEHPNNSDPSGEAFTVKTINDIMNSKYWKDTAIIVTYDESGGYWDHVAPKQLPAGPDGLQGDGTRIPALVISPYAKQNYVSHVQYDHSSVLKFIEWNFGVTSLNNRDQNANNMLDAFDFKKPDFTPYMFNDGSLKPKSYWGKPVKVKVNNAMMGVGNLNEAPFINKKGNVMVPLADFNRSINRHAIQDKNEKGQHGKFKAEEKDGVWISPTKQKYVPLKSIVKELGWSMTTNGDTVTVTSK